ncbi:MAG TPA: hypothetical protein VGB56_08955, partial [Flavisolibacter sp.]
DDEQSGNGKERKVIVVQGLETPAQYCIREQSTNGVFRLVCISPQGERKVLRFRYNQLFPSKKKGNLLIEVEGPTLSQIQEKAKEFSLVYAVLHGSYFKVKSFGLHYIRPVAKCKSGELPTSGNPLSLIVHKIDLDFNSPYNYHRDILNANLTFIRFIEANISRNLVVRQFILQLGLAHVFGRHLKNLTFGVVVSFTDEWMKIFLFASKTFREGYFIKSNPQEQMEQNSVVLVESNRNISIANSEWISEDHYVESEIIYLHKNGREGFIRGLGSGGDFYFMKQFCNFHPRVGAIVRFIPGINFSRRHQAKPTAYNVSFVSMNKDIAVVEAVEEWEDCLNIYLTDVRSGLSLFCRIYPSTRTEFDVKDIQIGARFRYLIPPIYQSASGTPRVVLQPFEEKDKIDMIEGN